MSAVVFPFQHEGKEEVSFGGALPPREIRVLLWAAAADLVPDPAMAVPTGYRLTKGDLAAAISKAGVPCSASIKLAYYPQSSGGHVVAAKVAETGLGYDADKAVYVDLVEGVSMSQAARELGISRETLYQWTSCESVQICCVSELRAPGTHAEDEPHALQTAHWDLPRNLRRDGSRP